MLPESALRDGKSTVRTMDLALLNRFAWSLGRWERLAYDEGQRT